MGASGRAIANGADYGFTKLIFDSEPIASSAHHRRPGGCDMIGEITLAIEMDAMRSISARRFTRTRRSAKASAWR